MVFLVLKLIKPMTDQYKEGSERSLETFIDKYALLIAFMTLIVSGMTVFYLIYAQ